MSDDGTPSPLAMRHERELSVLKTGLESLSQDVAGVKGWTKEIQQSLSDMGREMREAFSRQNQRNPTVYVGLASLAVTVIVVGAGLTMFAVSMSVMPLRERDAIHSKSIEDIETRQRENRDLLIRHDERLKIQSSVNRE